MLKAKTRQLKDAKSDLDRCFSHYIPSTPRERSISFIALTKAFEVALEYGWKKLKHEIEDRGLEANSPKDAAREAARLGLIDNPDIWINAINARNLSVHDYFSLEEKDFVEVIHNFAESLKKIL